MKKLLFLAVLFLSFSVTSFAQDIDKLPTITVTGSAEVLVVPDEVIFSLDVMKTNKELPIAKRLNDESVAKILELTKRFSVAAQNVQTAATSVEMKYDSIRDAKTKIFNDSGDEIGKRIFRGYEVSKTMTVKLTDVSRFEDFFSEVLKTGISNVNSIKFETSKFRENRDKARDMAMKAAKEKATAMTASIGQTMGKALRIIEGVATDRANYNLPLNGRNAISVAESFSESLATFAPGAIKIEAQVTVSFLLN